MKKRLSEDQIEQIKSLSMQKIEQNVIAEMVGCSVPTVRRYQQHYNIPASNRYRGGVLSEGVVPSPVSTEKNEAILELKPKEWVVLAEKNVVLYGHKTGFSYAVGTKGNEVRIKTGYCEDIQIGIKDLVAFGNEILDVAEAIQQMKKDVFSI